MANRQPLTWGEILLLVAIIALAGGLRAGYLMTCADNGQQIGPLQVEDSSPEQEELAGNLLEKQRFSVSSMYPLGEVDVADTSPGYPFLLAGAGKLNKHQVVLPLTMLWIQCGLGALTPGLYFLFARRVFRSRAVATLAGLLGAIHPFWIFDTATLADGVTATFLLALVLLLGVRASQTSGPLCSLLYGLALAALALVRAALLPFAFIALAWYLLRCRTLSRGWLAALLAFLGFVNGLAPWAIRNWQLFGQPVPIVNTTYYHLFLGNVPSERREVPKELWSDYYTMSPALEDYFVNEIRRELRDHPADTVRRRLQAGLDFVAGENWFQHGQLSEQTVTKESMPAWLAGSYAVVLEVTLLVLVVLGLLGWRWTYAWRHRAMPATLAMIWIPLPYILSHAETLSGPRLPLDGVLLTYAAFVLACLFPGRAILWAGESASRVGTGLS